MQISCDYWSLGVLAYELTIGSPPFTAQSTTALYSKITNHEKHLKFPPDLVLSQAYISLIKNLITDRKQRFSYKQIVQHPLFKNFDLNSLKDQVPPYIPKITSEDDLSNFSDIRPKRTEPNMENFKRKTQFSGRNLPFVGFTYTRDNCEDYSSSYSRNLKVKDETVQELKSQLQSLRRQIIKKDEITAEKMELEKQFEEKCLRLQGLEDLRNKLERDLSKSLSECLTLKRTLEIERKDRCEVENKVLDLLKSAKQKWEFAEKNRTQSLLSELQEKEEKIQQLTASNQKLNEQLKSELKNAMCLEDEQNNIKKLNRKSVIGLESRLDKITTESHHQLLELQANLSKQIKEKQLFVEQLAACKQKLAQTENNCEQLELKLKNTQTELSIAKQQIEDGGVIIFDYKKQLDQMQCKLKVVTSEYEEKVAELQKQLENKKYDFLAIQQDKQVCIYFL